MDFDKKMEATAAKPLDNTNEVDMGLKFKDQVAATGGFGHDTKTVLENPNLHDEDDGKVRPTNPSRGEASDTEWGHARRRAFARRGVWALGYPTTL